MRLYILGSGTPLPSADRFGSAYVVQIGDEYLMFDCGPSATQKLAKVGISAVDIDNLFFTHHHFDHDVDYPCFLLSRWNLEVGMENKLNVYGPKLTEQLTHRLMDENHGAFSHDWIARINHPLSLNSYQVRGGKLPRPKPEIIAKDIGPGKICNGKDWEITAAPAEHVEPWLDSLAYRIDSSEGSIVITGDTRPCESVLNLAKDVDTLVCLCVYLQEEIDGTPEADYMCGSITSAEMARDSNSRRLVLVHQIHTLDEKSKQEKALSDITNIFKGAVVWGEELMGLDLS